MKKGKENLNYQVSFFDNRISLYSFWNIIPIRILETDAIQSYALQKTKQPKMSSIPPILFMAQGSGFCFKAVPLFTRYLMSIGIMNNASESYCPRAWVSKSLIWPLSGPRQVFGSLWASGLPDLAAMGCTLQVVLWLGAEDVLKVREAIHNQPPNPQKAQNNHFLIFLKTQKSYLDPFRQKIYLISDRLSWPSEHALGIWKLLETFPQLDKYDRF